MIDSAIEVAAKAHHGQFRKGTDIPYISHPVAVGMILLQHGYDPQVVAAGILHDTIEDTTLTLDDIRARFGERVAIIVSGCSEPDKSLSWEQRKQHTIEFLRNAAPDIRAVACADKLHNIRCIAADHKVFGETIWDRFKRGRAQQSWYYTNIVGALCETVSDEREAKLLAELADEVEQLFGKL